MLSNDFRPTKCSHIFAIFSSTPNVYLLLRTYILLITKEEAQQNQKKKQVRKG